MDLLCQCISVRCRRHRRLRQTMDIINDLAEEIDEACNLVDSSSYQSSVFLLPRLSISVILAIAIHPVLHPQPGITTSLEDTTHLERPRYLSRLSHKEVSHFHGVSQNPIRQYRESKAFAGFGTLVGHYLRQRQYRFNGKADVANNLGIGRGTGWSNQCMKNEQGKGECTKVFPVSRWSKSRQHKISFIDLSSSPPMVALHDLGRLLPIILTAAVLSISRNPTACPRPCP